VRYLRDDILRLSGLLEGEGCFSVNGGNRGEFSGTPAVVMTTTDEDVAEWCSGLMGGKVCRRPAYRGKKPSYQVFLYGDSATNMMMIVYPYLISERRKARVREILTRRLNQLRQA